MSADTQALWDALVKDFGGDRAIQFQGRLAELLSQYRAECEQQSFWERTA